MADSRTKFDEFEITKAPFLDLSREVAPLIEQIMESMVKHGFTDGAHIYIGGSENEGYMSLEPHETEWKLAKYSSDRHFEAIYEFRERFPLEEGENG